MTTTDRYPKFLLPFVAKAADALMRGVDFHEVEAALKVFFPDPKLGAWAAQAAASRESCLSRGDEQSCSNALLHTKGWPHSWSERNSD